MLKWTRLGFEHADPPGICQFGITEAIASVIASVATAAGAGAAAGTIGTIGAGVLTGAAAGAGLSAIEGGNIGLGALTGGITGGLIPVGGDIASGLGISPVVGDVLGGAAGGAIGAGITGTNPLTGALEGGAAGGVSAALGGTSTQSEPAPALPGAEGAGVGGPVSPTGEQALAATAVPEVASGAATTATATDAGAPTTALGTLGGPTQAVEGNAALAGFGGGGGATDTGSAALSTLSQAPGTAVSDAGSGLPGGAGTQLALATDQPATSAGNVPIPDALNLPPITGPGSNVAGSIATQTPAGSATPLSGEIGTTTPAQAAPTTPASTGGGFATPSAEALLAAPAGASTAGADITNTATQVSGSGGSGGIGGFIKDNPLLVAAAPLALTLLRGDQLPSADTTLANQVAGPLAATEKSQLAAANAGTLTAPMAAQVGLFVQQSNAALYQSLANQGVTNPQNDSRYIAGVAQINEQALAMTQNFIQQEFTNAFTAAGDAASALTAVANAQVANDNAFTSALSGALTSFGLIYALQSKAA